MTSKQITFSSLVIAIALALTSSYAHAAGDAAKKTSWQGQAYDAWLDGKIEASFALNRHLNPFAIDTHVDKGVVRLTGAVESQIDKDLAEQIAASVDGVTEVDNDLTVKSDAAKQAASETGRSFGTRVDDATTTARVKIALLANESTEGLAIDVDTENGMVSLEGDVESKQESELAEEIAKNTEGVSKVDNRLKVTSPS